MTVYTALLKRQDHREKGLDDCQTLRARRGRAVRGHVIWAGMLKTASGLRFWFKTGLAVWLRLSVLTEHHTWLPQWFLMLRKLGERYTGFYYPLTVYASLTIFLN